MDKHRGKRNRHTPKPRWNDDELEWNPLDVRHPAPVKVYRTDDKPVSIHLNDGSAIDRMKDGIVLKEYEHKKIFQPPQPHVKRKGVNKMDMPPSGTRYAKLNPSSPTPLADIKLSAVDAKEERDG